MNKSTIILISGILLFSLLFGCLVLNGDENGLNDYLNGNGNNGLDETNVTENGNGIPDELIIIGPCNGTIQIDIDVCLMGHELCSKIKTPELRDQCFFNKLECDLINDEEKREDCEKILIERKCQNSDFPSLCKALLTDNVEFCGLNEECLLNFAYETKDDTLCEKIETSFVQTACYASVNRAWNECYHLEKYEATQSACLKIYSRIVGAGNTICDGLEESRYLYDCLSTVAFYTNNENLCRRILVHAPRRDCYYNIAYEYERPEVCDLSPEQYDADFCRVRLANKIYSPVICESIWDPRFKWGCFGDSIIKGKTTLSECEKLDGSMYPEWKKLCLNIAIEE